MSQTDEVLVVVEVTPSMKFWSLNYVANRGYCEVLADAVEGNPDYEWPEEKPNEYQDWDDLTLRDLAVDSRVKDEPVFILPITREVLKEHYKNHGLSISPLAFPGLEKALRFAYEKVEWTGEELLDMEEITWVSACGKVDLTFDRHSGVCHTYEMYEAGETDVIDIEAARQILDDIMDCDGLDDEEVLSHLVDYAWGAVWDEQS